jgi:hypothetical protein
MDYVTRKSVMTDAKMEITPEMIEAAMEILAGYDPEADRLKPTAARILRAALQKNVLPHA